MPVFRYISDSIMSKDKDQPSDDDTLSFLDDGEVEEADSQLEHLQQETAKFTSSKKADHKLEVKRRLDAYLERKWFQENGWEDDDELFSDDFFYEPHSRRHGHI